MSEMVDRVAKAIDAASQPPGQRDYRTLMENAARAAITAMREPTEAMKDAAGDNLNYGDDGGERNDFEREWQQAIEEALR